MIEIENLGFTYGGPSLLFDGFSLRIESGQTWSIIGPSGCGKSTLLHLLAGLKKPQAGTIKINGEPLDRPRPQTGLILQDHGLLPWSTLRENVTLGIRIRSFYGPDGRHSPKNFQPEHSTWDRVDYWLDRLGLADLGHQYPLQLSRGQRQRGAIARTLVLEPDILLLDEPFSALDAPSRKDLQDLFLHFRQEQDLTMILVTHDIEEAIYIGQNILVLDRGVNRSPHVLENNLTGRQDYQSHERYDSIRQELLTLLGGGS